MRFLSELIHSFILYRVQSIGRLLGGGKNWGWGLEGGNGALGGSMPLRAYLALTPSYVLLQRAYASGSHLHDLLPHQGPQINTNKDQGTQVRPPMCQIFCLRGAKSGQPRNNDSRFLPCLWLRPRPNSA